VHLSLRGVPIAAFGFIAVFSLAVEAIAQSPLPPNIDGSPLPEADDVFTTPFPEIEVPPEPPGTLTPPAPTPSEPDPVLPEVEAPEASPDSSEADLPTERFFVEEIEVLGSTVLQNEINQLVEPLEGTELSFEELLELRSRITQLYIDNGYVTSGAFLPNNQVLSDGVIQIQVVEGELETIEISGLNRLREAYVRDRLELAADTPLNQQDLEEALQLLQLNPLIARVNAELTSGSTPGRNILLVNLDEAPAFQAGIGGDNYRSPSTGSAQLSVGVSHDNVLGFGDRLSAEYGVTEGLDIFDVGYAIPLNARNGTLSLGYNNSESRIIEEEFEELDIRSETESFSVSFRQPVTQSPESEFALGVAFDLRESQTFILDDIPFSFSEGAEAGESKVSVIRFFQDWVNRDARRVLAARSQFSFGIDAFNATVNDTGTDGRFFSWLGQFQWVEQLSPRILLLTRIDAQLSPDSLLSLERFSLGGVDTVRGYAQNQLVSDNGILGSIEVRIPVTDDPRVLQITPFIDIGTAWNNRTPDPDPETIAGIGLGLRLQVGDDFTARLDYGIPLVDIENRGDSLQDNGIYLSLRYQPF
jgi:hemolysin activation/secretion protein